MTKKTASAGWPYTLKKTAPRMHVLSVLEASDTPLGAQEIFARLSQAGTPVWLSTVYRVLESFLAHGIITRAAVLDSDIALYTLTRNRHEHYAVCLACHRVIPMENCPMEAFIPRISEPGFILQGHKLELYGLCAACASVPQADNTEAFPSL